MEPIRTRAVRARRALGRALRPLPGPPTRGAVLGDAALGLSMALLCVGEMVLRALTGGLAPGEALGWGVGSVVMVVVVVGLARPYPLVALVVVVIASFQVYGAGPLLLCVAYLTGRRMPTVRPALVLAGVALVVGAVPLIGGAVDPGLWSMALAGLVLTVALPWLIGVYRRQHVELSTAGWEHARQLRREHRLVADQTRIRERSRIAQDMHDSLGHELSLIALRAGALEVDPELGERHREAVAELRATAVTATTHLREIIGVLRTDAEPDPIAPNGEDVIDLVERARDSGMRITLVRDGDTAHLPPMVGRAVHRVLQESLTNATRHAPGAEVAVSIATDGEHLEVRAVNPVPGTEGVDPGAGIGGRRGLIGLRERVRLVGGVFAAGPTGDGAWEVCAVLPVRGGEALPDEEEDEEETAIDRLQREARRRFRGGWSALIAAPAVMVAVLVFFVSWTIITEMEESTLTPEEFDRLRPGTPQSRVEKALPPLSVPFDARDLAEDAVPEGAVCNYYRSGSGLFDEETVFYQLCFTEGRLSSKGEAPIR
ncbi:sensor histidine kinase [Nocardiopsis lambiniae]|uniref:histidine kinase n=1 Tax=Nocardiopsis lambiniae TaxID=3075539 RepID=A0ABU2M3Y8_9ACTN|nr:histidine kinase [Nocardiopsis sp. DSM 44743]MDT0327347.1 histidine kinase [Nocardiopsis sp. DSM 44743]